MTGARRCVCAPRVAAFSKAAVPLMTSEVKLLLEEREAKAKEQAGDGDVELGDFLKDSLEYARRFAYFRTQENAIEARK